MRLLEYCESRQAWLLATLESLVRLESPSTDKTAVDRCGDALAMRLQALGAEVTRVKSAEHGDHIRASFAGGATRILLLGHFDTVWNVGQIARMPFEMREGRLYGPGVFDMKGGIAVAMLAVEALARFAGATAPTVTMLWTTDEEVGSETSRACIEEEARRSAAVLVLEPSLPGGAVKTRRKGCGDFVLTVRGVSAHAGIDPGKGVSAIHELAHQIVALESLQDPERGVSVNVGLVVGGTRANVIAEEARATIDVRVPAMADAHRVDQAIRNLRPHLRGTRLEIEGAIDRPPLERTPAVARLYQQAREVAAALGRHLGEGGSGGGSDGNFTAAIGVPTLDGLGPQGDGAHALHEHVLAEDLSWRPAFLCALMARLGGAALVE